MVLRRPKPQVAVAVVYVAAMFMSILDTTILNVALPAIGRDLKVSTAGIEWVVVGYLLSLATWIPASGWIGDKVGTKKVFLTAIVVFTASSAACGFAGSLPMLIAFRVAQGVGGGLLTPVGIAMLYRAFPPAERARASRVLVLPTAVAPATGPIMGGLLVDHLSWRWVFFINVPIGLAALVWGWLFLDERREPRPGGFDAPGFVLSGAGLAFVLYALSEGPQKGWTAASVVGTGVLGVAMLVALVRWELRRHEPMLRLRLLATNRLFRATNLTSFFGTAGFMGLIFVMPLYLQEARGYSPVVAGLTTFPEALGVLSFSQVSGRLYPKVGPRRLMAVGLAVVVCAFVAFTQIGAGTSLWTIRLLMFAAGAGMSFVFIPLQAASFATVSPSDTGHASAIFSTQRQAGAAIGVAVLATVLSQRLGGRPLGLETSSVFHTVFLAGGCMSLIAVAAALFVRDADAVATMSGAREHVAVAD